MCGEMGAEGLATRDPMGELKEARPDYTIPMFVEASDMLAATSFTMGPSVDTIATHRSPGPDNLGVNTVGLPVVTDELSTLSSAALDLMSGSYGGRVVVITVGVAIGTLYEGSHTFSRDDGGALFNSNVQWFKDSVAGNANSPQGTILFGVDTAVVPEDVPITWDPVVADTQCFMGGTTMGATCVNVFTRRLVCKIGEVIVLQSQSSREILITVVTNARRPGPVDVKAGLLPREPVFLEDLSVAGTAHTV